MTQPAHIVAIFGGGIAGSEAALRLADRGIRSVVFEMEALPWGKIELGLPKWHVKQRNKEEDGIDERIGHPLVSYVPLTKLGRDIIIDDVLKWGFSAIMLATGAWRDRPLAIEGIDDYQGRGFYYQNPYVAWFNQYHDPDYAGPQMEVVDGAVVVGGGLASLDVVKILMLETTVSRLRERGLEADLFALEKKGIPKILAQLGVEWDELGIEGCTLYYRRTAQDMPLMPLDDNPSEEKLAKARLVREKLLNNFLKKYLFRFEPCKVSVDKIVEGDRVAGLLFRDTEVADGRVRVLDGTETEVRTPLVISSIGSIPEPMPGIEMEWELLKVENEDTGKLAGFDDVFALGNAVTGRGNIQASRVHGRQVADYLMDEFLDWRVEDAIRLGEATAAGAGRQADEIATTFLSEKRLKSGAQIDAILEETLVHQQRAGYDGDYATWVDSHRPSRLEDL